MPNRILRDGILASARVNALSWPAEVFYRRLFGVVDDFGRYDARPAILRSMLYPLQLDRVTEQSIEEFLGECVDRGLLNRYVVDGKPYLEILDFGQRLRAKKSRWPAPATCEHLHTYASKCMQMRSESDVIRSSPSPPPSPSPSPNTHIDVAFVQIEKAGDAGASVRYDSGICTADGALPLDEFFEQRYRLHPKKRDRGIAERAFCEIPGIDTADVQRAFSQGHDAWIACEDWQWKGGVKAPTFGEFIADQTWRYSPPSVADRDDIDSRILKNLGAE